MAATAARDCRIPIGCAEVSGAAIPSSALRSAVLFVVELHWGCENRGVRPEQRFADLQPESERAGLTERLDEERRAVLAQASDLSPDELHARPLASTDLTIGRLIKHLAFVEDRWFQHKLLGLELPEPWCSIEDSIAHDWSFYSADADSAEDLLSLYAAACERSRGATARCPSLDTLAVYPSFDRKPVNLRWLLAHMIDETARHSGHADLIRDALGRPPAR